MKVAAIADSDTIIGLRLAGVRDSYLVESPQQAEEMLRKVLQDQDVGLIILTEKIADKVRDMINDFTSQRTFPVIVEIPDKRGTEQGRRDPLKDIIRRAVGLEVKV
ncbi:MAG: V-type ATP synthase subunit F [Candidatus Atabeyarchaeum deiterrae]